MCPFVNVRNLSKHNVIRKTGKCKQEMRKTVKASIIFEIKRP